MKTKKTTKTAPLRRITRADVREVTGLNDRRLRQLAEEGYFPQPDRAGYDAIPTLQGLLRFYRQKAESARTPLRIIQERRAEKEDRLVAIRLAREEGAVVSRAVLATADARAITATKREMYQAFTTDIPLRLEGKDLAERRAILRAGCDQVCERMANISDRKSESHVDVPA